MMIAFTAYLLVPCQKSGRGRGGGWAGLAARRPGLLLVSSPSHIQTRISNDRCQYCALDGEMHTLQCGTGIFMPSCSRDPSGGMQIFW